MAAITPTKVQVLRGLVTDLISGTAADNYALVEIQATTTATTNTFDVSTQVPCTLVVGPFSEVINGAVAATDSTLSGSTITFAGHTGAGAYKGVFLIKQ